MAILFLSHSLHNGLVIITKQNIKYRTHLATRECIFGIIIVDDNVGVTLNIIMGIMDNRTPYRN